MSGFVCILDRSGAEVEPAELDRLSAPLTSRASSSASICAGPVAITMVHTTQPARRDHHGPVTDPASGLVAAVAGRFHRVDRSSAPPPAGNRQAPRCAAQALAALGRGDAAFPAAVSGSFVLIGADPEAGWLSVTRDHLGDLKVYYHLAPRWLIAASEPEPILRHRAVTGALDERTAARFLGFRFSHSERSFFRQIKELPPAHRLRVTAGDSASEQYWRFRVDREVAGLSRQRLCARFRNEVRRSVANQIDGLQPRQMALSLSGGLDSTTLAALAPTGIRAYSWGFDDPAQHLEQRNVAAVAEHLRLRVRQVDGNGLYPLAGDYVERFVHRGSPHLNAFAALKRELYRTAVAEGCRRVMVGDSGDALYAAEEYWLVDSVAAGQPRAVAGLWRAIQSAAGGDRLSRLALRRLLPIDRALRPGRDPLPWLTDLGRAQLPRAARSPILPPSRRPRRYELSFGAKATELESEERRLFDQCGIERSNPFHFWPLAQMMISLPGWWLHDAGRDKILTREAMKDLLPSALFVSDPVGLLGDFFLCGIEARRRELRRTVFRHPTSDWQRYVERTWLEPYLDDTRTLGFGHTILWRVISYELWQRRLASLA